MSEEELNQMNNNELIGIIKAQKFEIEQLENIRKEAIKYVKEDWFVEGQQRDDYKFDKDLLNILNKGDNNGFA